MSAHVRFIFFSLVLDSSFSSMPRLCFFWVLYFFRCSAIFLFILHYFIFVYVIYFHFPFMRVTSHVLPLSVHILSLSLHAMPKISQTFPFVLSCPSDFPVVSLSVRLIFFLIFPFMSLSFYSLVTSVSFPFSFKSFHFSCMSYHFLKHIECPRMFVSNYVHGPWFFSWFSMPFCASFQFFTSYHVLSLRGRPTQQMCRVTFEYSLCEIYRKKQGLVMFGMS